jgi:thiamine kinase-like enzyme
MNNVKVINLKVARARFVDRAQYERYMYFRFYKDMYTAEEYKKEIALFDDELKEGFAGTPTVLCHNDANATNIIYQEKKGGSSQETSEDI